MTFFIDIIAQSYLLHTRINDEEIAQFYYQQFLRVKEGSDSKTIFSKNQFYNYLKSEIDTLIDKSYSKKPSVKKPRVNFGDVITRFEEDLVDIQIHEEERQALYQDEMDMLGIAPRVDANWEKCDDAEKLTNAINNKGIDLKDPIVIIKPSEDIHSGSMVLRKSKLEYLKVEVGRAKNANSIDELDLVQDDKPMENEDSTTYSEVEKEVRNAFDFTLKKDPGKHKIILSKVDFNNLVKWVTFYFENDFELPVIEQPIINVHTSKTNIRYTFKLLFKFLNPGMRYPKNFDMFSSKCFHYLNINGKQGKDAIAKTSIPDHYYELVDSKNSN